MQFSTPLSPPLTQKKVSQQSKPTKRTYKGKAKNQNCKSQPTPLKEANVGEFVEEEEDVLQDSGFDISQGETIYEELDNPENYEDRSDFDEPHFY